MTPCIYRLFLVFFCKFANEKRITNSFFFLVHFRKRKTKTEFVFHFSFFVRKFENEKTKNKKKFAIRFSFASLKTKTEKGLRYSFFVRKFENEKEKTVYTRTHMASAPRRNSGLPALTRRVYNNLNFKGKPYRLTCW